MSKYTIIVNPFAGKGKAGESIPLIQQELTRLGLDFELIRTEYPWHAAEIAEKAIINGTKFVVSVGGDGTANEVINGIMLARKAGYNDAGMGVLPIGRGNDFAFSMGVPTKLDDCFKAIAGGACRKIDVGLVTGGLYPNGRYFGNGVGLGFDAVVGFVNAELPFTGFTGYLVAALKTMWIYHPAPVMRITIDDNQPFDQPCLMVSIMNGIRLGGGFMVAPTSQPDDKVFDLCIAHEVSRPAILGIIPLFFSGTQAKHKAISMRQGAKIHVSAVSGSLPVHADGETICTHGDEITVELLPGQISLLHLAEDKPA